MARQPSLISMNIGSNRSVVFSVPYKIIEYFGIIVVGDAAAAKSYLRKRKPHERKIHQKGTINATVVRTVSVEGAEFPDMRTPEAGFIAGKLIKIPTQLNSDPADPNSSFRMVSLRTPSIATNYCIAMWMNQVFVTKKPTYFLTPSGRKYPVNVPIIADPNPGNDVPVTP